MSASRLAQQRLERANARGGSSSFQRENSAYGAFYPGAGSVSKKAAGPGGSPAPTAWNPYNSVSRPSNQSYGGFYDGGDGSGQAEPKKGGRFTPLRGTMEPTAQSPQQKIAQSRPGDYSEAGGGMALRQQQNQGSCMDVDSYLRKNSTAAVEQPAKQVAYSRLSTGAEQAASHPSHYWPTLERSATPLHQLVPSHDAPPTTTTLHAPPATHHWSCVLIDC